MIPRSFDAFISEAESFYSVLVHDHGSTLLSISSKSVSLINVDNFVDAVEKLYDQDHYEKVMTAIQEFFICLFSYPHSKDSLMMQLKASHITPSRYFHLLGKLRYFYGMSISHFYPEDNLEKKQHAFSHLQWAADNTENNYAFLKAGLMYYTGTGTQKNFEKAIFYLQKHIDQTPPKSRAAEAYYYLAEIKNQDPSADQLFFDAAYSDNAPITLALSALLKLYNRAPDHDDPIRAAKLYQRIYGTVITKKWLSHKDPVIANDAKKLRDASVDALDKLPHKKYQVRYYKILHDAKTFEKNFSTLSETTSCDTLWSFIKDDFFFDETCRTQAMLVLLDRHFKPTQGQLTDENLYEIIENLKTYVEHFDFNKKKLSTLELALYVRSLIYILQTRTKELRVAVDFTYSTSLVPFIQRVLINHLSTVTEKFQSVHHLWIQRLQRHSREYLYTYASRKMVTEFFAPPEKRKPAEELLQQFGGGYGFFGLTCFVNGVLEHEGTNMNAQDQERLAKLQSVLKIMLNILVLITEDRPHPNLHSTPGT